MAPTVKTDIQFCGGIYRDVTLIITGKPYFTKAHFLCTGLEQNNPSIQLDLALGAKQDAQIHAELLDATGALVAQSQAKIKKGAGLIPGPAITHPRSGPRKTRTSTRCR